MLFSNQLGEGRKRLWKRKGREAERETEEKLSCLCPVMGGVPVSWSRFFWAKPRLSWESQEARGEGGGGTRGEVGRGSFAEFASTLPRIRKTSGVTESALSRESLRGRGLPLTQITFCNYLSLAVPQFLSLQLLKTFLSMGANCRLAPMGLGARVSAPVGGDEMLCASPPFSLPLNHLSEGPFPSVHSVTR